MLALELSEALAVPSLLSEALNLSPGKDINVLREVSVNVTVWSVSFERFL